MTRTFEVDLQHLDEVSKQIRDTLKAERATDKEIQRTLLLIEEITVKFKMCMPDAPVTATVSKWFGSLRVNLHAKGEEHNPISETQNWAEGSEDYYRTLILRANKNILSYHRTEGQNVVAILVHTSEKQYVRYSMIALLCGIALGVLLGSTLNHDALSWLDENVFTVIQAIFMNAMTCMVVPAVFCAVVTNITSLSSLSDTGRMGGRIMGLYLLTTIIAIVVSFGITVPLFSAFIMEEPSLGSVGPSALAAPSAKELVLGIIPSSLLSPMETGNMVQVLFLAVISGLAMGILGIKVDSLRRLISALNDVFQTMIALIAMVVPILTFVSMTSLVARYGLIPLPVILLLVLAELLGCIAMFGFYNLMLPIFGRISPAPYARKVLRFFRKVNPRASSGEYLPKVVGLCTDKLGVSERVASFSAALGASVNMDGSAIHMIVCSVLMARLFGVPLNAQNMFTIGLMALLLSGGAAAVQNSGMLSVSSLSVMMGIPTSAISLLFGVDQILDLTRTASNAIGDVSVCVIISKQENELDQQTYRS